MASNNDQNGGDDNDERTGPPGGGAADDDSPGGVGALIGKLFTTGISAAFMTEESIRGFVGDMKLPKETLNLLLQGASKSKDEITNRVSREVINIISKIDFVKEASRFMEEHKFKITAEIEVLKKDPDAGQSANASTVQVKVDKKKR